MSTELTALPVAHWALFDLISGLNCPPALSIWIRNPMVFNWAYIFLSLFETIKNVLERFWSALENHFQFSWGTCGKTHLRLQLIPGDGLADVWSLPNGEDLFWQSACKYISRLHPALTSAQLGFRGVRDFSWGSRPWNLSGPGCPLLTEAGAHKNSTKWDGAWIWGMGEGMVMAQVFLSVDRERPPGFVGFGCSTSFLPTWVNGKSH